MSLRQCLKILAATLLLLAAIALVHDGLLPRSDKLFNDYRQRLQRVLNIKIGVVNPHQLGQGTIIWRNYHLTEPDLRLSFVDSFKLNRCGLQQTVFQKNSSLGKQASAVYKLIWHSQIIFGLARCSNNADIDPKFSLVLNRLLSRKLQASAIYWHNFLVDEISLRQLWTRRDRLSQTPSGAYRKLAERIKHLASYQTVLQNGAALDEAALLLQLKQLDQSPSIFSLFSELNRATIWLKSISESLKHAEFRCVSSNQQQYKILDNVLNKVYMAKVQRYLAELDQSASVVNIALAQLYHAPSFTTLISKTQLIQQRFHQANRQHVIQWQEIIASCTAT